MVWRRLCWVALLLRRFRNRDLCICGPSGLALVAVGLSMAQAAPASAACVVPAGTADGFDKETAGSRAQRALDDHIQQYMAENHLEAITIGAMRAEPPPCWRAG